jgi:hypothetical protein
MRTVTESPATAERVSILVVVAILHIAVYWLLSSTVPARMPGHQQPLQLLLIKSPSHESAAPTAGNRPRHQALKPRRAPAADDALTLMAPDEQSSSAPIDWNAELDRAAKSASLGEPSQAQRDFGFPHAAPSAPAKPAEFGWDRIHAHRIEAVPGGGLAIHLNDHCVFLLLPLPFLGCSIGSKPANGELFDHMHDEPHIGPSSVP